MHHNLSNFHLNSVFLAFLVLIFLKGFLKADLNLNQEFLDYLTAVFPLEIQPVRLRKSLKCLKLEK